MYGKREEEMAMEAAEFSDWVRSLPPSTASATLQAAMQAWINLLSGGGLYGPEHAKLLSRLAELLQKVSSYFMKGLEDFPSTEQQLFLDRNQPYSECLKETLQGLAALCPASMGLDDLENAESSLISMLELLKDMTHAHLKELEKRRGKLEGKAAPTGQSAGPSRRPPQSGFCTRAPPPRPRPENGPHPQTNTAVRHMDPISSGRYVSGPLYDDPPPYDGQRLEGRSGTSTQAGGQVLDSKSPPQHQRRDSPDPESESESYSRHHGCDGRARTDPTTRGGGEGFGPRGGRTGLSKAKAPLTRRYGGERCPCGCGRDVRAATTPTVHECEGEYPRREYARNCNRYGRGPPIVTRRNDEDFYHRGGQDERRVTRAPRSEDGHTCMRSRNEHSETEPMSREDYEGVRRAGVRPQHPGIRTTRSDGVVGEDYEGARRAGVRPRHPDMRTTQSDGVVGNGPRESRRHYPTAGQERSGQEEVDRLGHRLNATRLDQAPKITIGSNNVTGNNIRNVQRSPRAFPLNGRGGYTSWTSDHGYDHDYDDGYYYDDHYTDGYYYDDHYTDDYDYDHDYPYDENYSDFSRQRGGWGRGVQGPSRYYN